MKAETHQILAFVCVVVLRNPSDLEVCSKPHPIPKLFLFFTSEQMSSGSEFRGAVDGTQLHPCVHQGISHLRCEWPATIGLSNSELILVEMILRPTTYSSGFKISIAFGESAHCSRKGGMAHSAFDFVLTTESRIFFGLGSIGAAKGSCKDVGEYIAALLSVAIGASS